MSLRFCPQCGLSVENQPWTFCPACGYPLRDANASSSPNLNGSPNGIRPVSRPTINTDSFRRAFIHFQQAQNYFQQAFDKLRGAKG